MTVRDIVGHIGCGADMEITVCEWHGVLIGDYDVKTYLDKELPTDYLDRPLLDYTIYCGNIVIDIMGVK